MAFFTWKKLGKIASKAGRTILKEAADKTTGGLYSVAASRLKSLGQVHAARRQLANVGTIAPAHVRATIEKQTLHLPAQRSLYTKAPKTPRVTRSRAPKGSPLTPGPIAAQNGKSAKAPKAAKPLTAAAAARKAANARKYAAWKAAGKPGKFFDWAKAHK